MKQSFKDEERRLGRSQLRQMVRIQLEIDEKAAVSGNFRIKSIFFSMKSISPSIKSIVFSMKFINNTSLPHINMCVPVSTF